jgi:hypothetical protein
MTYGIYQLSTPFRFCQQFFEAISANSGWEGKDIQGGGRGNWFKTAETWLL